MQGLNEKLKEMLLVLLILCVKVDSKVAPDSNSLPVFLCSKLKTACLLSLSHVTEGITISMQYAEGKDLET